MAFRWQHIVPDMSRHPLPPHLYVLCFSDEHFWSLPNYSFPGAIHQLWETVDHVSSMANFSTIAFSVRFIKVQQRPTWLVRRRSASRSALQLKYRKIISAIVRLVATYPVLLAICYATYENMDTQAPESSTILRVCATKFNSRSRIPSSDDTDHRPHINTRIYRYKIHIFPRISLIPSTIPPHLFALSILPS